MTESELIETLEDLKSRLPIDQFALEKECREQPIFYQEVGEIYAEVRKEAKKVKSNFGHVKAELERNIRSEPAKYGISKITESAIQAAIVLQTEYANAETELFDAEEVADNLSVLLESAAQRKSMLRELVSLFVRSYYADVSLGKEAKEVGEVSDSQIVAARKSSAAERAREQVEEDSE